VLDEAARAFVQAALEQDPQVYGLPMTTWTVRDLQALLLRERTIRVSVCTLQRVVPGRAWSCMPWAIAIAVRAMIYVTARTPKPWRRPSGYWSGSKKSLLASGRSAAAGPHLVYVDECEIHPHPPLAQVGRKKGQPMRIPAAGADRKCTIFGALDYASGRLVHSISPRKDETAFMTVLEQLLPALPPEALVVVLDHAGYHKPLAMREWWRAHAAQL
jgi:hypothetical protein